MKAYVLYKDKSVKGFKRLMVSGGSSLFDKYKTLASSFIRYAGSDLDKNLSMYDSILDLNTINLENVFPTKYRWLVSNVALKNSRDYLESLEQRITEFEGGKEENLKLLVGIQFVRFVLITKIVETYLGAAAAMKKNGLNVSALKLEDIGIGKSTLKYFDGIDDLCSKTIDDWLNYNADTVVARYFYSSMKRILSVLIGTDSVI